MSHVIVLSATTPDNNFPAEYFGMADGDHFWCRWRANIFFNLLKRLNIDKTDFLSVFDIGCGNGVVRRQIEQSTTWITDGTDFSMEALNQNVSLRGKTYYYDITEQRPEFRERYDLIVLFDVLEHVNNTETFLASLAFHLKPGGWLFVNVPALNVLRSSYDDVQGHYRRYTRTLLANEFKNLPFSLYWTGYWGFSQLPLLLLRKFVLRFFTREKNIYTVGFHPPAPFINKIMFRIMQLETSLLNNPPLGTSVMGVFQKEQ